MAPLNLLPEAVGAGARAALQPLRACIWRNWLYRRLLRGPLTDHIAVSPQDARPCRLEDADQLLRGRFRFHGETLEAKPGTSVFDLTSPSRAWAEALNGFAWLGPLALAGGEAARTLATNLIAQWLKRYPRYVEPQWSAHVMARRLIQIYCHGALVIPSSDMVWRSRLFVSLRDQTELLARIAHHAPDGLPRLEASAALALSGVCLEGNRRLLAAGLLRLDQEIARQILPDGGHISRSPEALAEAYRLLVMVSDALLARHEEPPHSLRNALDRMAPMLRFFRHGDGALSLFQGGRESEPKMIANLLARDPVRGQPFGHARHSGYQRLAAGRTIIQIDCGGIPPGPFAGEAHAGFLAFEMSSGPYRLVVNCGAGGRMHRDWDVPLRATAAHSTLVLADRSSAEILPEGMVRKFLGPRLIHGPKNASSERRETALGWMVEAGHDAYAEMFGLRHERQITLSPQGLLVTGADRLVAVHGTPPALSFVLRFHLHPDVRLSRLESGGVLIKLPNGEGWRFRAGGPVSVEESVYVGGDTVRRAEQLVIAGETHGETTEIAWVFEQIVV